MKIKIGLVFVLVFCMVFSYHPFFIREKGMQIENVLSLPVMIIFILTFLLSFSIKTIFDSKQIGVTIVLSGFFFLTILLLYSLGYSVESKSNILPLIIIIAAMMIGWQLDLSEKQYKFILVFFGCMTLFVTASQIFFYIGALVIEDLYLAYGKNALGCIVASTTIIFLLLSMKKGDGKLLSVFFMALSILTFIFLLTIRARTAALMTILMFIFIVYKKFASKKRNIFLSFSLTLVLLFVVYLLLPEIAKNYIYNSFFQRREFDITTGRIERNMMAIDFLKDNLFFGNIKGISNVPTVHNYPLLQTYNFGLVGAFANLALYFYLIYFVIKSLLRVDIFDVKNIGIVLVAISFGISMAEPTYPFGPGTANVFNFITLGISLRYNMGNNKPKTKLLT